MNDRTKLQQLEVRLSYVAVDHAHLQLEKVQKLHCLQVCMIDSIAWPLGGARIWARDQGSVGTGIRSRIASRGLIVHDLEGRNKEEEFSGCRIYHLGFTGLSSVFLKTE